MRGLVLNQPWASLVASGVKVVETRGWSTGYRGDVVISASKGWGFGGLRATRESVTCGDPQVGEALRGMGVLDVKDMSRGVALCVVCLERIISGRVALELFPGQAPFGFFVDPFGGQRFGWVLSDLRVFPEPVGWSGAQGLYELSVEQLAAVAAVDIPRVPL